MVSSRAPGGRRGLCRVVSFSDAPATLSNTAPESFTPSAEDVVPLLVEAKSCSSTRGSTAKGSKPRHAVFAESKLRAESSGVMPWHSLWPEEAQSFAAQSGAQAGAMTKQRMVMLASKAARRLVARCRLDSSILLLRYAALQQSSTQPAQQISDWSTN